MKILKALYDDIVMKYGPVPPEQGGIIGIKDSVICGYVHDNLPQSLNQAIYSPSIDFLNDCIEKWAEKGIDFCGIVHSHAAGQNTLSSGDMEYIKALYEANPQLKKTFFPLILKDCDMIVYAAERNGGIITVLTDSLEKVD